MMKSATTKLAWVFLSWLLLNPSAAIKFNQTGPHPISERKVANDADDIDEFFKNVTAKSTSRIHYSFGGNELRGLPAIGNYQRIWKEKFAASSIHLCSLMSNSSLESWPLTSRMSHPSRKLKFRLGCRKQAFALRPQDNKEDAAFMLLLFTVLHCSNSNRSYIQTGRYGWISQRT